MTNLITNSIEKLAREKGLPPNAYLGAYPTIAELVMWIFNTHKIWISVNTNTAMTLFTANVIQKDIGDVNNESKFDTIDSAYLAAIEYTLNNLIN